ncbi:MAG TPA: Gfo/Idh/MocA family oxidoreductase [Pirellulales bacterium]|jgi:predicted dehydrogenase|nr:Gfo/Idh/MocA family oxidoreductase [Pirellulales bacterium]
MTHHELDRRQFLERATLLTVAGAALGAGGPLSAAEPVEPKAADTQPSANETLTIGVMGVNGRGKDLSKGFCKLPNCRVQFIADVDERARVKAADLVESTCGKRPEVLGDFRKILDNPAVDALVIAAPDHWHAPAAILACAAKKHVYVEKPCCHNPHEGELLVAASQKYDRIVQMGSQRRSFPAIQEAIEKVRGGTIGKVLYARCWYDNHRPSIGHGKEAAVPSWLDYTLWQGPAPATKYHDNYLHYNWHWFWNWGTGELGNNGIHALDVCRWGLNVEFPQRVTSTGGKLRHDDDQQTPDTNVVTYNFGDKMITWEGLSWSPRGWEGDQFGMTFHGTEGTLAIVDKGYKIYDLQNKQIDAKEGNTSESQHFANFLQGVRLHQKPSATIEEGYKSTLLCHLGNISYRVGRELKTDPKNGHIQDDPEAAALWRREYQPGWEPKI